MVQLETQACRPHWLRIAASLGVTALGIVTNEQAVSFVGYTLTAMQVMWDAAKVIGPAGSRTLESASDSLILSPREDRQMIDELHQDIVSFVAEAS